MALVAGLKLAGDRLQSPDFGQSGISQLDSPVNPGLNLVEPLVDFSPQLFELLAHFG